MDLKNWEKKIAVRKVERALENYGFKVRTNINNEVHGDLIGQWKLNRREYLFYVTARFNKPEADSTQFKNSQKYCQENNLRLVVVCWEFERRLFDYAMDLDDGDTLGFKIVEFSRIDKLNQEWEEVTAKESRVS